MIFRNVLGDRSGEKSRITKVMGHHNGWIKRSKIKGGNGVGVITTIGSREGGKGG